MAGIGAPVPQVEGEYEMTLPTDLAQRDAFFTAHRYLADQLGRLVRLLSTIEPAASAQVSEVTFSFLCNYSRNTGL
eukprot:SAG31_NODE_3786_length_3882_cov_2.127941_1_plen_76_part_00